MLGRDGFELLRKIRALGMSAGAVFHYRYIRFSQARKRAYVPGSARHRPLTDLALGFTLYFGQRLCAVCL